MVDLLDPVHEFLRLARDLEGHGRQAVVEVFQPRGHVDGCALGIGGEELGPAVGKRAQDRIRPVSKRFVPRFLDGCFRGREYLAHQGGDVGGVVPDDGYASFGADTADQ